MSNKTNAYVIPSKEAVKRELATYRFLYTHAIKRRAEIREKVVAQESRRLRGQILNRLGNEIDNFGNHIAILEGYLAELNELEG